MKKLAALLLLCTAAHAQTYDVDVAFNGAGAPGAPALLETFTGSFTYANGQISAINILDPPWSDPGVPATQFNVVQVSSDAQATYLNFLDLEGAPSMAAAGSNVWTFGLQVYGLGTDSATIGDASFYHAGPAPIACGADYGLYSCSVKTLSVSAPEITPLAAPLVLLLGALALLRAQTKKSASK